MQLINLKEFFDPTLLNMKMIEEDGNGGSYSCKGNLLVLCMYIINLKTRLSSLMACGLNSILEAHGVLNKVLYLLTFMKPPCNRKPKLVLIE